MEIALSTCFLQPDVEFLGENAPHRTSLMMIHYRGCLLHSFTVGEQGKHGELQPQQQ